MGKSNHLLFKFSTTRKESSYPRFYGMSIQPYIDHLCHTISFIMTLEPRSLICQLSSPTSTFKKVQSKKDSTTFQTKGEISSLPSFSLELREEGRRGICNGRILIYTKITTRVLPHQDRPKQMTKTCQQITFRLNHPRGNSF